MGLSRGGARRGRDRASPLPRTVVSQAKPRRSHAIYEGSRSLYINPNECVDCGACEPVCPTEAIFYEDDLPDEWAWYKDAAVSFFAEVGDFGGASAHGPIGHDPEQVAALPPQNQD